MDTRCVELVSMNDPSAPPTGTLGTVTRIGALGDLEVQWDNGSTLHLIPGVDTWKEKLRVVYVAPGEPARISHIDNTNSACRALIEGMMTVVCPFDDPVVIVANDNAIAEGHGPNRTIHGTIIPGPFFVVGETDDGDFCSLSVSLADKYKKRFEILESFPTQRLRVVTRSICPLCGSAYTQRPAISRIDDETPICPRCGTRQALEQLNLPAIIIQSILLDTYGE